MQPIVNGFFDQDTFTISYVVADPETRRCAIIDPVLGYDPKSGHTCAAPAETIAEYVETEHLAVDWILETHVHADHLTSAAYLQRRLGGKTAISRRVTIVQDFFARLFNLGETFEPDGSQFDHLLDDNERIAVGNLELSALATPGHTTGCMTYLVGDAAFVGDTLFMPDYGTARADFPGGDAATLYRSIKRILELPPTTRLFMCHDYTAPGRDDYRWETTVAEQRRSNIHIADGVTESEFVAFRRERDARLAVPVLLLPAVQVNIRGGALPAAEDNGIQYLKIPLNSI